MLISVGGDGEYVIVPVFHAVAHVIDDPVVENIELEHLMLMGSCTELESGKLGDDILEYFGHVVVEFVY